MPIQRSDGFVVQSGKRMRRRLQGERRGAHRSVGIMVQGDKVPEYEFTLEDLGRYRDQPVLPFNAFGTLAMARREAEPNSGRHNSSSFFASPAHAVRYQHFGQSLLIFGYVVEGKSSFASPVDDEIVAMKKSWLENLVNEAKEAFDQEHRITQQLHSPRVTISRAIHSTRF